MGDLCKVGMLCQLKIVCTLMQASSFPLKIHFHITAILAFQQKTEEPNQSKIPQALISHFNQEGGVISPDTLIFSVDFHKYNAVFGLEHLFPGSRHLSSCSREQRT